MNNVGNMIDQLGKQRSAIERAISALRDITDSIVRAPTAPVRDQSPPGRRLSPEGRRTIIAATEKRWAAKRAEEATQNSERRRKSAHSPAKSAGRKHPRNSSVKSKATPHRAPGER